MRIRVLLKDPDTMHDAVDDAFKALTRPDGVSKAEWSDICEERAQEAKGAISGRWMQYGEYLEVEFDIDADTATVVPHKR